VGGRHLRFAFLQSTLHLQPCMPGNIVIYRRGFFLLTAALGLPEVRAPRPFAKQCGGVHLFGLVHRGELLRREEVVSLQTCGGLKNHETEKPCLAFRDRGSGGDFSSGSWMQLERVLSGVLFDRCPEIVGKCPYMFKLPRPMFTVVHRGSISFTASVRILRVLRALSDAATALLQAARAAWME
jgi:hypothetical protein